MDFIDEAYSFLLLLSLPVFGLLKEKERKYLINIIAVANSVLLFNSVFVARQLYALRSIMKQLNATEHNSLHSGFGWFELRLLLIILLPLLFLFKKLSANGWLTLLMFVLLNWSWGQRSISSGQDFFSTWSIYGSGSDLVFNILNYLSLLVGGYALLWLLKRLPNQQVN